MSSTLNLTKDPIPNLIKRIAIPASIGTFFQTMFNIVDVYFAGKISPEALSALAKSFPIYFIIIAACVGVTVGGTSLIANSIGENNKDKIFDPFFTTRKNGTGLGLTLTRDILREHQSEIQVSQSNLGGSAFSFLLKEEHEVAKNPQEDGRLAP